MQIMKICKIGKYAKLTKYTAMKKHKMQMCKAKLREGIKNRYFTVRLTVSVYVSRSRLLNPPPPLTVSLTVKYPFFLTTHLIDDNEKRTGTNHSLTRSLLSFFCSTLIRPRSNHYLPFFVRRF